MTARSRRGSLVAALAAVSVLALGACTSSSEIENAAAEKSAAPSALIVNTTPDQDRIHTTEDQDAIDLLPDGAFPDGVLRVSVTQGAVPLAFYADDNATVIGSETDIATLVADEVCFLDGGRVLERGPGEQVLADPIEPRTRQFLRRIIEAGRL